MTAPASPASPADSGQPVPSGLAPAIAAYVIWGFLPLYLLLVTAVPPFEFVGWRIIFTLPLCLLIVAFRRQFPELLAALKSPRALLALLASAALIGVNWFIYVWAIMEGQVYAASIGYYLNPLINVLLGTLFLGERLSRRQWLAVAVAGLAVALLAAGAITSLWISLSLAFSFAFYGLVRKTGFGWIIARSDDRERNPAAARQRRGAVVCRRAARLVLRAGLVPEPCHHLFGRGYCGAAAAVRAGCAADGLFRAGLHPVSGAHYCLYPWPHDLPPTA